MTTVPSQTRLPKVDADPVLATPQRDHIFISYATEEAALADWLARKLAAAGYAVWYDRLKLLGGEPWPQDIDVAIKTRTVRMLALLSHASLAKPNPTGERTTAQTLSRVLGIPDFLIPVNADGLRPHELTWNLSPLNYIALHENWADGLAAILKKLESVNAPRPLAQGAALAVSSLDTTRHLRDEPELLCSNCLQVKTIPEVVHRFRLTAPLTDENVHDFRRRWPFRSVSPTTVLSFCAPPADLAAELGTQRAGGACWRNAKDIDGIYPRSLVVSLLHASIDHLFASKGFVFSPQQGRWFVPDGLFPNDWLKYRRPDGHASRVAAIGERTFRSGAFTEVYRYHLSPSLSVLRGQEDPFVLFMRNRVYLTDQEKVPLEGRKVVSRRKHLCKNWWNDDWLARTLGIAQHLADAEGLIRIGHDAAEQVVIEGHPITAEVRPRLDEEGSLETDTAYLRDDDAAEDDDPEGGAK